MTGFEAEDRSQPGSDAVAEDRARAGADGVAQLMRSVAASPGRRLAIAGTLNLRDIGGYPVVQPAEADQGTGSWHTAWRTLYRADAPHRPVASAADKLDGFGKLDLRTVLDLRSSIEADNAPSPDFAGHGIATMRIPLAGEDLAALPPDLRRIYDFVIDERGAAIAGAVRAIARPGGLPGLVHCTAGKDRTGIVIALVLSAIGVPDAVVAADYALSSLYLDPARTPVIGRLTAAIGIDDGVTTALLASPPELILGVLDRARQRAGTIPGYLTRHGVTDADLAMLRAGLVTRS
jgi:protein-tyrosine phosphatase